MTRYDDPKARGTDGVSPHPLAGVPQSALDAARETLREALPDLRGTGWGTPSMRDDEDTLRAVAEAVLAAAIEEGHLCAGCVQQERQAVVTLLRHSQHHGAAYAISEGLHRT